MIDLKALMVEREDCDAGTVQKLREGLAQGGNQYRTLRDVTEVLEKKAEAATGTSAKRWHLKLGIALFFLGGEVIHGFSLAMIYGIVFGTYSSIFVALPLLLYMELPRRQIAAEAEAAAKKAPA